MFIPVAIHAIHGSCILYKWCLYICGNLPKRFKSPPRIGWRTVKPAQGAGGVAPALEWTPPPRDPYQRQRRDQSQPIRVKETQKALGMLPRRMCKNLLFNYYSGVIFASLCQTQFSPHFCASGRHRLGHLSLNRHPAIGNDIAPHYCQQLQRSRSAAGETPFLS